MKKVSLFIVLIVSFYINEAMCQWNASGNNIYNTNTGNVGIGNNSPTTLLYVGKSMTEPTITVRNMGGSGGATYVMMDDASGANWKFKATLSGGFKIRDHANLMDVITIEPNSFANAIYIKTADNIGIGTATPDNSALVDMTSNTKGMLVPRMNQSQMISISNPTDGLIVYCTTDGKMYIYVLLLNLWKEIAYGSGNYGPFTCGSPITVNHIAGTVAPVNKTVTYGTVTNVPGETTKCWITKNLGADNQATSKTDNTEAAAGWYWQFNRMQGYKHDGTTITPDNTWVISIDENSNWLLSNDPCAIELGSGWRLPSFTEWNNVDAVGGWTNWNGPWDSALKMHAAGFLNSLNGSLLNRGSYGYYWSSTQYDSSNGLLLYFGSGYCDWSGSGKAEGFSSRCLRD